LAVFLGTFLLWPDQQKVKDYKNKKEGKQLGQCARATGTGGRGSPSFSRIVESAPDGT